MRQPRQQQHEENSNVLVGRRPVLEALKAGSAIERIFLAQGLAPAGVLAEIRRQAQEVGVPIRSIPRTQLDAMSAGGGHQGVVALTGRYRYVALERLLTIEEPALLFLDGVTDPQNLGSLLRSADGAGFDGLVIPSHRAAGVTATVRRVSAGAAEVVPVARVVNIAQALETARRKGVWTVGLDEKADEDIWHCQLAERPVGLVLGAEGRGLSRNVRHYCDAFASIPYVGAIGSLNVAVAGAIAMFEVARRQRVSHTV